MSPCRAWGTDRQVVVLLLLVAAPRPTLAETKYTIRDLGALGGSHGEAHAVNENGWVAGQGKVAQNSRAFLARPVRWGLLTTKIPPLPGGAFNWSEGINKWGHVVGTSDTGVLMHAFLYKGGLVLDLHTLPGGMNSKAHGLNDSGQVVGESTVTNGDGHAFLWRDSDDDGQVDIDEMVDLGKGVAYGINTSGKIVGRFPGGQLWTPKVANGSTGSVSELGLDAVAINDDGDLVGSMDAGGGQKHGFLWRDLDKDGKKDPGELVDLGTLGGAKSWAFGLNNKGQVVGNSWIQSLDNTAFVWKDKNQNGFTDPGDMLDLNKILPPNSGWYLHQAHDINDQGQIVGHGAIGGEEHAYRLTPVAIAALTLDPSSVAGCKPATGRVYLLDQAPSPGVNVKLESNPLITVPAEVTVAEKKTSASFDAATKPVGSTTLVNVTAELEGGVAVQALQIRPIGVGSVKLDPAEVTGGDSVQQVIALECVAAPAAITVSVSSSDPDLVPTIGTFDLPFGSGSVAYSLPTAAVASMTKVTITGTANGVSASAELTLWPIGPKTLTLAPNPVPGETTVAGTVTLEHAAAPGVVVVDLLSTDPSVAQPAVNQITIPEGEIEGTFSVTTAAVAANTPVILRAVAAGKIASATLVVTP
jgi:probable HAF family extracellular repeat protein